jgi:hypothetical protein
MNCGQSAVQKHRTPNSETASARGVNSNCGLSVVHWRTVRKLRISKNRAPEKSPPLKLLSICGQISTTATKIGTQDHKTVSELLLREDHRSIWSRSTGNRKGMKNTGFETLFHDLPRSVISWGIGWFSSVERLNSRHRSFQRKKNESKRSQNEKLVQEREWEKDEREEQNTNHKKLITNRIPEDTRWLGPPFLQQILSSYTNLSICEPLLQEP